MVRKRTTDHIHSMIAVRQEIVLSAYCPLPRAVERKSLDHSTGISSEIRTKLRDWAAWQARAGCYSQAVVSSNDSKTLYNSRKRAWPF